MPGHRFNVPLATKVGWRMVFRDEVAAIYVREAGPNAALATDGYRVLNHLTTPQELYAALGTLNPIDVAHDGARAMEQAPTSPRGLLFGLIGAFAVRDRDAFDSAAAKLEALAPNDGDVADLRARWSEPRAK
jgi:hypothetical protein